jgi:hypothetical protein
MTERTQRPPKRDARDIRAFTPVFDGLCPGMTIEKPVILRCERPQVASLEG